MGKSARAEKLKAGDELASQMAMAAAPEVDGQSAAGAFAQWMRRNGYAADAEVRRVSADFAEASEEFAARLETALVRMEAASSRGQKAFEKSKAEENKALYPLALRLASKFGPTKGWSAGQAQAFAEAISDPEWEGPGVEQLAKEVTTLSGGPNTEAGQGGKANIWLLEDCPDLESFEKEFGQLAQGTRFSARDLTDIFVLAHEMSHAVYMDKGAGGGTWALGAAERLRQLGDGPEALAAAVAADKGRGPELLQEMLADVRACALASAYTGIGVDRFAAAAQKIRASEESQSALAEGLARLAKGGSGRGAESLPTAWAGSAGNDHNTMLALELLRRDGRSGEQLLAEPAAAGEIAAKAVVALAKSGALHGKGKGADENAGVKARLLAQSAQESADRIESSLGKPGEESKMEAALDFLEKLGKRRVARDRKETAAQSQAAQGSPKAN